MKPHCIFIVPCDFGSVGKICSFAVGKEGAVIGDFDVHLRPECPLSFQPSPKAESAASCSGFFLNVSPAWLNLPDESYCLGGAGLPVGGRMFHICCK